LNATTSPLYARRCTSRGGTIPTRVGLRVPRTANSSSAADATGNKDHSKAKAPVTKGAVTLVRWAKNELRKLKRSIDRRIFAVWKFYTRSFTGRGSSQSAQAARGRYTTFRLTALAYFCRASNPRWLEPRASQTTRRESSAVERAQSGICLNT
jgi:hypothetical protein